MNKRQQKKMLKRSLTTLATVEVLARVSNHEKENVVRLSLQMLRANVGLLHVSANYCWMLISKQRVKVLTFKDGQQVAQATFTARQIINDCRHYRRDWTSIDAFRKWMITGEAGGE